MRASVNHRSARPVHRTPWPPAVLTARASDRRLCVGKFGGKITVHQSCLFSASARWCLSLSHSFAGDCVPPEGYLGRSCPARPPGPLQTSSAVKVPRPPGSLTARGPRSQPLKGVCLSWVHARRPAARAPRTSCRDECEPCGRGLGSREAAVPWSQRATARRGGRRASPSSRQSRAP